MRIIILALCAFLCACSPQIIREPIPVPCPTPVIPPEPIYPILTKDASPSQVMKYFLEKDMLKSKRIEELEKVLNGYK